MSSSPSGPLSVVFQKLITSRSSEGRMAVTITCSEVPGTPGSHLTCTTPSLSFSIRVLEPLSTICFTNSWGIRLYLL